MSHPVLVLSECALRKGLRSTVREHGEKSICHIIITVTGKEPRRMRQRQQKLVEYKSFYSFS